MNTATRRSWAVWGVAVFAYAVAVFQRTSLAVAADLATSRFHIGASVLSLFAVLQLVMYAAMQIPVGVLVDRLGSRAMIALGGGVMAGGQLLLSLADAPGPAVAARVLVGVGDAMTFIAVLRIIPAWFPTRQVPLVTQLTGLLGQLGQVASTIPLVALLAGPGWTASYLGAAAVGVLTAILVVLAVRNRPARRPARPDARPAGGRRSGTSGPPSCSRAPGWACGRTSAPSSPAWCSPCCGGSRS